MALKMSSVGLKINKSWKEILKMGSYLEWEITVSQMEMFIEGIQKWILSRERRILFKVHTF
jgi:hypothetical protein